MKDDIIKMAREAGLLRSGDGWTEPNRWGATEIERFAALVLANHPPQSSMAWQEGYEAGAAAEREACAKVCESLAGQQWVTREAALECSDAIRARGNT